MSQVPVSSSEWGGLDALNSCTFWESYTNLAESADEMYEDLLSRFLHYCQLKWKLVYLHSSPCRFCMFKGTHSLASRASSQPKSFFHSRFCKCCLALLNEKIKKGGVGDGTYSVCTQLFKKCSATVFWFFSENIHTKKSAWNLCKKVILYPFAKSA